MDILTHGLTGIAFSTAIMAHSKNTWRQKVVIGSCGLLGGILPDVDVISKWSGFDATFGVWFGLKESGNAIFGQTHWYSHHVFTHSIVGALFFTLLLIGSYIGIKQLQKRKHSPQLKLYALAFLLGYMGHLFEDMITPGGPWKGIAFFWPSTDFTGGWGKIWWWDNYDLFLIVCAAILINGIILLSRYKTKLLSKLTLLIGLLLFVIQIERRDYDYNQKAHAQNTKEAKDAQKRYLGEPLYTFIQKVDEMIPVAF
ncbi:metal-dependent hydrolase [Carboxylicivirga sp. N1Y90]|uniref:metal-dependent hydrolase n=1 Tax=Carboxylicivirga fragile TaxID=3417571 RepID=UPI003D32F270|nr:metal-dependent hydrolase [Marinilabiliaceae bacterium N1Y90]